jgi:hypothetical protein
LQKRERLRKSYLSRLFSQDDGELGFAGFGGVVEGGAFAVGVGGAEEEALFGIFGESDEAGFAVGVGSDLEIELVEVGESVGDVDADVGGVDGSAGFVGDGEIGGAWAESGVDFGDGFWVGLGVVFLVSRGGVGLSNGEGEKGQSEGDRERAFGWGWHTLLEYARRAIAMCSKKDDLHQYRFSASCLAG